jgi:hypothetical protein
MGGVIQPVVQSFKLENDVVKEQNILIAIINMVFFLLLMPLIESSNLKKWNFNHKMTVID